MHDSSIQQQCLIKFTDLVFMGDKNMSEYKLTHKTLCELILPRKSGHKESGVYNPFWRSSNEQETQNLYKRI